MIKVQPKVYLIAKTELNESGLEEFLSDIKQSEWNSNAQSDPDMLTEFGGRLCYRSFSVYDENNKEGTNPNVTRIREDNGQYVKNLIDSGHHSVLEHSTLSLLFHNISRVYSHEMVRHRLMSYSQESLRYIRLDNIKAWLPDEIKENPELNKLYEDTICHLEGVQEKLNKIVKLDGKSFDEKKKWTSRFRRLAPIGLATTILVSGNLRAWRHIINMRTSKGAEEEMRLVMNQVVPILKNFAPAVFADLNQINGEWKFEFNPKP